MILVVVVGDKVAEEVRLPPSSPRDDRKDIRSIDDWLPGLDCPEVGNVKAEEV